MKTKNRLTSYQFTGSGIFTGSEGRLTFPYQRVGMINALRELSNAPEGKHLNSLSKTICNFLLSCYKDDGRFL